MQDPIELNRSPVMRVATAIMADGQEVADTQGASVTVSRRLLEPAVGRNWRYRAVSSGDCQNGRRGPMVQITLDQPRSGFAEGSGRREVEV